MNCSWSMCTKATRTVFRGTTGLRDPFPPGPWLRTHSSEIAGKLNGFFLRGRWRWKKYRPLFQVIRRGTSVSWGQHHRSGHTGGGAAKTRLHHMMRTWFSFSLFPLSLAEKEEDMWMCFFKQGNVYHHHHGPKEIRLFLFWKLADFEGQSTIKTLYDRFWWKCRVFPEWFLSILFSKSRTTCSC